MATKEELVALVTAKGDEGEWQERAPAGTTRGVLPAACLLFVR
jgi:hypothetical protein